MAILDTTESLRPLPFARDDSAEESYRWRRSAHEDSERRAPIRRTHEDRRASGLPHLPATQGCRGLRRNRGGGQAARSRRGSPTRTGDRRGMVPVVAGSANGPAADHPSPLCLSPEKSPDPHTRENRAGKADAVRGPVVARRTAAQVPDCGDEGIPGAAGQLEHGRDRWRSRHQPLQGQRCRAGSIGRTTCRLDGRDGRCSPMRSTDAGGQWSFSPTGAAFASASSRGLRRRDIDLLRGWVDVREQVVDIGGRFLVGPPKTDAGRRRVAIPPHIRDEVGRHLAEFVRADADAFVFTGHLGEGPVATATWLRSWSAARNATGLRHLHFHDLRHAGNTLAAATGASTRELMARMGHASPRQPSSTSTPRPIATRPSPLLCRISPPKQSSRESSAAMDARWRLFRRSPSTLETRIYSL